MNKLFAVLTLFFCINTYAKNTAEANKTISLNYGSLVSVNSEFVNSNGDILNVACPIDFPATGIASKTIPVLNSSFSSLETFLSQGTEENIHVTIESLLGSKFSNKNED